MIPAVVPGSAHGALPHPNAVAEALTGRRYVSYSALTTYAACPLRYFFKYIENLPEETVSASLIFGSALHRALQRHFEELLSGAAPPQIEALMEAYGDGWAEIDEQIVKFNKGDDLQTLEDLARRMLTAFQDSDLARPAGRILAIEEELRGEIVPGCPDLLARVDIVIDSSDQLTVIDFKTSRGPWSHNQVQIASPQLLLYHELVKPLADGRPVELAFTILTKAKSPAVEQLPVSVNIWKIARTKHIVERIWQAIQAQIFYPSPSPQQCPTCPFREPCRNWCGK